SCDVQLFVFSYHAHHRDLHSFPTRRSSDLGWRIVSRGEVHSGIATTFIDLTPDGPRFDIDVVRQTHALDLQLNTSAVPYEGIRQDRKSTRLNSSHVKISYAVFCLKKKKYSA